MPPNPTVQQEKDATASRRLGFAWRVFAIIAITTVLLVLIIGYSFRIGHHMTAKYAPAISAAQNIRIEATLAHLWLEEIISGDESESFDTVQQHLANAFDYTRLLLAGGVYNGHHYLPLSDPALRQQVIGIEADLERFRLITDQRYEALTVDRAGSEIDKKFDGTFRQFSATAETVAEHLRELITAELENFRRLQMTLMMTCVLLAAALLALLYRYERQRATHLREIYHANAQLDRLSLTDGLTGVPNRRYFDQQLAIEWRRAQREQAPITLLMLDIDFFKPYNDHYGHLRGDQCLRKVASAIDRFCRRPADTLARFGGEEFALILPNTVGAEAQAEKVRSAVAGLGLPHARNEAADHITLSVGYCTLIPSQAQEVDELIQAADEALYRAKKQGRNRIEGCNRNLDKQMVS